MQLVERHIFTNNNEYFEICSKAKRLYNFVLYNYRQALFGKQHYFKEYEMTGILAEFDQIDYRSLPAKTSQGVVKQLFVNIKSWQKAKKDYYKNPKRYKSCPRVPNYKKSQFVTTFDYQQIKIKDGYVHFPKQSNLSPIKTRHENIKQIRIIPQATCHVVEIVYNKNVIDKQLNKDNFVSIDLGINNLISTSNNVGQRPFLINGKIIKSYNQRFNKTKSNLQSLLPNKQFSSKQIERLTHKRNCWMDDKLHKISRFIINDCIKNDIGTIIVGYNKGWKQEINIGSVNNQKFVQIPHRRLIDKILYKSKLVGIDVIEHEESYTSKCDALALEPICKHDKYLGKRVKRGLFQSSTNKLINADVNGSINIARNVIRNNDSLNRLLNNGNVFLPYKINVY